MVQMIVFFLCEHDDFASYRTLDVTLDLKDPQYPEQNLGSLEFAVTLTPKEGDVKDAVRSLLENTQNCAFIFIIS